jgi:GTP cyclohydrolase I
MFESEHKCHRCDHTTPSDIPLRDKSRAAADCFEDAGGLLLLGAGVYPLAPGTIRTPERFSKAMQHLLSGYQQTPEGVVGTGIFPSESQGLVSVRSVEFFSLCEHHMLPFWGSMSVAYYPSSQIVGLSKIPRLVNLFARRLQVQERLTKEVAEAMDELLKPRALIVRASAQHLCMMMRGVEKQQSHTLTECHKGLNNISESEKQRLFRAVD